MPSPKLVIFNLDNTLVLTRPAAKEGYKQAIFFLAKKHGLERQKDKLYNHWKRLVQSLKSEKLPDKRRFSYSLNLLCQAHKLPTKNIPLAVNLYEKEMLKHLKPAKGAKELLSSLRQGKIYIAVTTGSDRGEAVNKLKVTNLFPMINLLVTATDVGTMKPNPNFYQITLKEFTIPASKVMVISDSQKDDLIPAKTLGITTYLVLPQENLMAFKTKLGLI